MPCSRLCICDAGDFLDTCSTISSAPTALAESGHAAAAKAARKSPDSGWWGFQAMAIGCSSSCLT